MYNHSNLNALFLKMGRFLRSTKYQISKTILYKRIILEMNNRLNLLKKTELFQQVFHYPKIIQAHKFQK